MGMKVNELLTSVDTTALLSRPLSSWRPILSQECQVYVFGETYLAKRFDQIHYKFCDKMEAKEIVVDNVYALLRFKYFPKISEEIDDRIQKIVNSFTANLKTTLKKVSFDNSADCDIINQLPDTCVAFRNGVFDFKKNDWFFKYDVLSVESIANKIYMYRPDYAVMWYLNYDFEPLPINIEKTSLEEFLEFMKEVTKAKSTQNYCFELLYNIAHGIDDKFSYNKFIHLCEILGYTLLQSFSQHFVLLIGSGQNGKNSLFDGCFINRVIPKPAANDLDSIELDRFITGALENKAHNIFLETSAKTYKESKMIKALTGSMYQTIEQKGIPKYSSIINCKYIFAGNDQDNIKFSDNTRGFIRRINMFEIYYQWDSAKRFLKRGDYYDTTFSDSLYELKNDVANTTMYIYFGMYGILHATKNFTSNFKFTMNDWKQKYVELDTELKEAVNKITLNRVLEFARIEGKTEDERKAVLYDTERNRLYLSKSMKFYGVTSFNDMLTVLADEELSTAYFADNDIFISLRALQSLTGYVGTNIQFTTSFKKIYRSATFENLYNNKPYVKITFVGNKLKLIR